MTSIYCVLCNKGAAAPAAGGFNFISQPNVKSAINVMESKIKDIPQDSPERRDILDTLIKFIRPMEEALVQVSGNEGNEGRMILEAQRKNAAKLSKIRLLVMKLKTRQEKMMHDVTNSLDESVTQNRCAVDFGVKGLDDIKKHNTPGKTSWKLQPDVQGLSYHIGELPGPMYKELLASLKRRLDTYTDEIQRLSSHCSLELEAERMFSIDGLTENLPSVETVPAQVLQVLQRQSKTFIAIAARVAATNASVAKFKATFIHDKGEDPFAKQDEKEIKELLQKKENIKKKVADKINPLKKNSQAGAAAAPQPAAAPAAVPQPPFLAIAPVGGGGAFGGAVLPGVSGNLGGFGAFGGIIFNCIYFLISNVSPCTYAHTNLHQVR